MNKALLPKVLYGLLFCVLLPALLVIWSRSVTVNMPVGQWQVAGGVVAALGIIVALRGMYDLWQHGKGLPMNAFPPEHYVHLGSYALFRHPIYTGFCIACAGLSCMAASPSGLYLITPIMVVSCWALVWGYEQPDLEKRFGRIRHRSIFSLPENSSSPAGAIEKLRTFAGVFGVWLLFYEWLIFAGVGENFIDTTLEFEKMLPVIPVAEIPYFAAYIFVGAAPFITRSKAHLRSFARDSWWIVTIGLFLQLVLPFYSSQRPVSSGGFLMEAMQWERSLDGPAAAFPSFHVMWALVAAVAWMKSYPAYRWIWITLGMVIAWSCHATGVHSMADILSGMIVFAIVRYRAVIWNFLQRISQYVANSWRSWTFGNFRIINHSVYAGLAGLVGVGITSFFIADHIVLLVITLATLLGGAAWGQWIEGSSKLLRPFGYYGAIAGGIAGVFICHVAFNFPWQKSIGAFAMASPWTQAIGRFRCLVQGCCHGRITGARLGIVYWNDHSRVCKISGLKGMPIHNTQLYSIVSNTVIGMLLWRFWYGGAGSTMLAGLYLILNGAARFVEESYRGEIQTRQAGKIPIYQWIAIGCMVTGAWLTTVNSPGLLLADRYPSAASVLTILFAGLSSAFAMGMDFPRSNVPFSRLSG